MGSQSLKRSHTTIQTSKTMGFFFHAQKFGVDVEKFQHMTGDCPNEFLQTALCCCQVNVMSVITRIPQSCSSHFLHVYGGGGRGE